MRLCDDSHIRTLNMEWRQKDEATDVLSFPMDTAMLPPGYPQRMLGDLVISLTTAERQALAAGWDLITSHPLKPLPLKFCDPMTRFLGKCQRVSLGW